jgi:hypothetical protein
MIATVPYSIVRQPVGGRVCRPTDRNSAPYHLVRGSGVLFFPLSLTPGARSGGERNSPTLISPCWREPSTERGHCTLFT